MVLIEHTHIFHMMCFLVFFSFFQFFSFKLIHSSEKHNEPFFLKGRYNTQQINIKNMCGFFILGKHNYRLIGKNWCKAQLSFYSNRVKVAMKFCFGAFLILYYFSIIGDI